MLSEYEQTMLAGWEDVHKKSQLTLWVLVALKDSSKHMSEVKDFIADMTQEVIVADDKSMYRALRRFYEADLVSYSERDNPGGPKQKIYALTASGEKILAEFIQRNIVKPLYSDRFKSIIE